MVGGYRAAGDKVDVPGADTENPQRLTPCRHMPGAYPALWGGIGEPVHHGIAGIRSEFSGDVLRGRKAQRDERTQQSGQYDSAPRCVARLVHADQLVAANTGCCG